MSDLQGQIVPTATTERAIPDGYTSWNIYWTSEHHQSWRFEPEINEERQRYLAERRTIRPNIERGIYPFRGIKLDRADLEWLLATHESGGVRGPVVWEQEKGKPESKRREGLDLRGADLRHIHLTGLPLARMRGGLTHSERTQATHVQRYNAAVRLEEANLDRAHLEQAVLGRVRLDRANLEYAQLRKTDLGGAHLEHASLRGANLAGAYLRRVFVDEATNFDAVILGDHELGFIIAVDGSWSKTNLATIKWRQVRMLGDEMRAKRSTHTDGTRKSRQRRIENYEDATRANRQLALALRSQGLNEQGDRFAYRAQLCERQVLRRQGIKMWPAYIGSLFLWALSGYGYRIWRIFAAYAVVLLAFAAIFYVVGFPSDQPATNQQVALDALLVSFTAIHGRVFFEQFGFSLQAWLTALESVIGIVLEGVFVAMLIQRWFQR